MENFKSFGKKLTVPFFPGFTAITGPNGSGKSNIVDAILFVLGPKSSKVMRAGRLTDLIFNGGKKQKNPAKYCKVSLVFDNRDRKMPLDYDEVLLTRLIRRAPLKNDPDNYYSYYYINGRAATFAKFVDVLAYARISGDGYNIVKQGDVTNLVKIGSIERRKILDDVAGISTFDADIKKAEQERTDAEHNMERIHIILNEITSQIRQLKKDRDAAYRYKELKEQLYETKAKIAMKKKREVETQLAEVSRQIEQYKQEQQACEHQQTELKKQYDELRENLDELEKNMAVSGGDEAKELRQKIEELRREDVKIEERINYSKDEISELKQENQEISTTLEAITTELAEYNEQKTSLAEELQQHENLSKALEEQLNEIRDTIAKTDDASMELAQELVKMREEYHEFQQNLHELELQRDRFTETLTGLDHQLAELEETKATYEFELKDISWQADEYSKEQKNKTKKKKTLEQHVFEKKKQETEQSEQLSDLDRAMRSLQRELAKLQAEYDAVQSVHAQYNHAVDSVLQARDDGGLKGIYGTVAELAQVDEKFKTSLEIAAGARMQSIIVEDDSAAAEAISFLQKRNLGRATFLPLNKMLVGKPRAKALMVVKDETANGFAIDLVRFDERYRSAFWYVFGDTVIVDNLSDARRLMGGVRLVDLKGNLIEASGAMIGGSAPKLHIGFGTADRKRLDEVTNQLRTTEEHYEKAAEELTILREELASLETVLRSLQDGPIDTTEKEIGVHKKEYEGKLRVLLEQITATQSEKTSISEKLTKSTTEIETVNHRLTELDALKEKKGTALMKHSKKENTQQIRSLESELTQVQETVLTQRSEIETLRTKHELIATREKELSTKIQENETKISGFKQSITDLKDKHAQLQDEIKALLNVERQMSTKVEGLGKNRDVVYKQVVTIEHEMDKLGTRMESYNELISRSKIRTPTLEETIAELDQELRLYGVEVKEKNIPTVEALKQSMHVIEESMQELEPVNMRALEEYEHQSERKKKFDEDVAHLKDQRKNLMQLVDEISVKKRDRFFEVFNEVNQNFKQIYAQLSEGGEAELMLENEDDVFSHGLTVKAQPRGKKILRLEALSGGEKSIASLGFIFSIQQYDPSPFYVLDEIDMFLDGVNAETVSRMIKKNALHTQFINVSLRKIVLKEANHIYGVTMHDNGVSEMIGNIDPESVGPKGDIIVRGGDVA
ncbi:MAG: chromosome segregation protein SMC [Candidatus Thermoplasmatota archaeon]|nr:chromosome segregation protein SMC [Candidatus Thermoplasmatota archaeon]